jgi:hypothetical protein
MNDLSRRRRGVIATLRGTVALLGSTVSTFDPRHRFQFVWWWDNFWSLWPRYIGPYPNDPDGGTFIVGTRIPYHGCIYAWRWIFGPLEVRRWSDSTLAQRANPEPKRVFDSPHPEAVSPRRNDD